MWLKCEGDFGIKVCVNLWVYGVGNFLLVYVGGEYVVEYLNYIVVIVIWGCYCFLYMELMIVYMMFNF